MANYKSQPVTLSASATSVFSKFSNLENLRSLLEKVPADKIPADKREMFDNISITHDSISVPAGPVGNLTFRVVEKIEPSFIKLDAENSPIPLTMSLHISPTTAGSCTAFADIDISLPPMLKPMVGGHIQKMADQFGQVLKSIPFA